MEILGNTFASLLAQPKLLVGLALAALVAIRFAPRIRRWFRHDVASLIDKDAARRFESDHT